MRLQIGQAAPNFSLPDTHGQTICLDDYRGRFLLLSFYRYASCPFCNLRVHALIQRQAEFETSDLALIAVFQSPRARIQQHVGTQRPPFPILADPDLRLYRAYQVETSLRALVVGATRGMGKALRAMRLGFLPGSIQGSMMRVPADFLIDPQGQIAIAYYGQDVSDHLPIEAALQRLNAPLSKKIY